jgi:hypothetical protein
MQLMLTNKGPTPLPYGTTDDGGQEGLLPPGLEMAVARDEVSVFIVGEQPEPAGRSKLNALAVDPASPLAVEYATDIDQWKGRSDDVAETAVMHVVVAVKNVGHDDVTVTTTEGVTTLAKDDYVLVETIGGAKIEGAAVTPPPPDPDEPFDVDVTGFTAELDPVMTLSDASNVDNGDTVTLTAVAGDPAAMSAIDGQSGAVYGKSGSTVKMPGIDLSTFNVDGLTATAHVVPVPDTTGTITAFTAANPTAATMDAEDEGLLTVGGILTLEALAGDPAAMAVIDGQIVEVLSVAPVTLGIDLSAVDVTGLTADFIVG